jgi:tight adherence protein B
MVALAICLVFLATFTAAAIAVAVASMVMRRREAVSTASGAAAGVAENEPPLLIREETLSTISLWHQLLTRVDFIEILKTRISEAGLRWSIGRTTASMLLGGAVGAAVAFGFDWMPPGASIVLAAAGAAPPYLYILNRRTARFRKFEEQFPDALDSLARAMRAGHPFGSGMELLAGECPAPLGGEIRRACDEWRLGLSWNQALNNLAGRVPILELRLFTAAVILQTRSGGKLSEVLEKLAETIRDSASLRGDVRAISANGRMTGSVLTILPIAIAGVMFVTSPAYITNLIVYPQGKYLLMASGICLVLGHFVIRKIVNIKI